jgi:hypothetical protein
MTARLRHTPEPLFGVRRDRRSPRPAVLFFDDAGCEQFDQVAGCLRRRSVAAIRAIPRRSGGDGPSLASFTRWLRDRLFFDRCVRLGSAADLAALETRFHLLDVLLAESTVAGIGLEDPLVEALGRRSRAFAEHSPRRLLDKFEVNALLEQAGVRIPPQCAASALSPQKAVRAFGLPLVVKGRVGLGGNRVRIAHSLAEVEKALRDLSDGDPGRCFYQAHVEGKQVGYICVRDTDGPLLDYGYRVDATQWRLGPSANVAVDADSSLVAIGRAVVNALGCRAFAQIDMIRDASGQVWPIDANLRPSSNTLSFLCLNVDLTAAYVSMLLGQARRETSPSAPTGLDTADVFPFALFDAAEHGPPARFAAVASQFRLICRRGPGWRYRLLVAVKLLSLRLLRRRRRRQRETGLDCGGLSTDPSR